MSTRYKGDPYWLTTKFPGRCNRCNHVIAKGEKAFRYPKQGLIYCSSDACGQNLSREFEAAAQDEDFYNSQY
jgi:transcription elongation factor Elf1